MQLFKVEELVTKWLLRCKKQTVVLIRRLIFHNVDQVLQEEKEEDNIRLVI